MKSYEVRQKKSSGSTHITQIRLQWLTERNETRDEKSLNLNQESIQ